MYKLLAFFGMFMLIAALFPERNAVVKAMIIPYLTSHQQFPSRKNELQRPFLVVHTAPEFDHMVCLLTLQVFLKFHSNYSIQIILFKLFHSRK